jgi:hypothetical protein
MSGLWWKILVRKSPLYDKEVDEEQAPQKVKGGFDATDDFYFPRLNNANLEGSPISGKSLDNPQTPNFTHFFESPDKKTRAGIIHQGGNKYGIHHFATKQDEQAKGLGREGLNQLRSELEAHHGGPVEMTPLEVTTDSQGFWDKMQSENITNMLKEAKSPKALAHKRKYETQYESSPARKKYRRELEGERRKRGVAGKGGKDMSHTKTGKIVPEDPHTNRARSHPSVGSTLKMVVVKAPLYDTATGKQVAGVPTPAPPTDDPNFEYDFSNHGPVKPNQRFLYQSPNQKVRAIVESNGKHATIPLFATHNDARYKGRGREALRDIKTELRSIHPNVEHIEPTGVTAEALGFWDKMHDEGLVSYDGEIPPIPNIDRETGEPFERGEPINIAMRLLKDFNTCYQCGQTWEQLGLANALPVQRSLHEDRCMGMATSEKDSMFQQQ